MDFSQLSRRLNWRSRSISPENLMGEPGKGGATPLEEGSACLAARDLGTGWKVNPYVIIQPGETFQMARIEGAGRITHIWLTPTGRWRDLVLRMYWDGQQNPSVEAPAGDFFCMGWQKYAQISSAAVCVNPGSGMNSYFEMPFRTGALVTAQNIGPDPIRLYYQIDYCLCEVPADTLYFCAQFRRVNPLPYKEVYTILDGVKGTGHYVGTYMAWGVNNGGWWGEGEIKFYIDADRAYPTICGTGTEDYFCGSYDFEDPQTHQNYLPFTTPYTGIQTG